MNITWYGQTCFKISTKQNQQEVNIIIDPISRKSGLKPIKLNADIVCLSDDTNPFLDINEIKKAKNPFIILNPGEFEIKNVFITSIQSENTNNNNLIFKIEAEDINIVHLGFLKSKKLTQEQIESLGNIDILMIPVGNFESINAQQANEIISQLEPRIIIPMLYKIKGLNYELDDLSHFTKELGVGNINPITKLKINKKNLPIENFEVIILSNL